MEFKEYSFLWSSPVDFIMFNNAAKFNDRGLPTLVAMFWVSLLKLNNTSMQLYGSVSLRQLPSGRILPCTGQKIKKLDEN